MKYLNKSFMVPVGQIRDENHPKAADLDILFPKQKKDKDGKKGSDDKK